MLSTTYNPSALCITATRQNPGYYGPIVVDGHNACCHGWGGSSIQIFYRIAGNTTYHYAGDTYPDSTGRFHVTPPVPYCAYSKIDVSASSVWRDSNTVTVPSIC
jgi:hypothetical protein